MLIGAGIVRQDGVRGAGGSRPGEAPHGALLDLGIFQITRDRDPVLRQAGEIFRQVGPPGIADQDLCAACVQVGQPGHDAPGEVALVADVTGENDVPAFILPDQVGLAGMQDNAVGIGRSAP